MRSLLFPLFAVVVALCTSGCEPRGETETLETVHRLAQLRFQEAKEDSTVRAGEQSEVAERLAKVEQALSNMVGEEGRYTREDFTLVLEQLSWLVDRAGYTTRPAFGELMEQYRALGSADLKKVFPPRVELLAARTYTLLSQELETTSFQVPRV